MASLDTKDPKVLGAAVLLAGGLIGGGSMLGITIEPEETTELRVDFGKLETQVLLLEGQLKECEQTLSDKENRKSARQQKGSK